MLNVYKGIGNKRAISEATPQPQRLFVIVCVVNVFPYNTNIQDYKFFVDSNIIQ